MVYTVSIDRDLWTMIWILQGGELVMVLLIVRLLMVLLIFSLFWCCFGVVDSQGSFDFVDSYN